MLTKFQICFLLLIWLVLPATSFAQNVPSGKWWRMPRVAEQLNLSDKEKGQLDELFLDSRRKLIDLKGGLEREQLELENLLEKEALDETGVMEQFKKLESARASLAAEHFRFLLEVRKVIGFDRFQRLKMFYRLLRQARERQGGEHSKLQRSGLIRSAHKWRGKGQVFF